MSTSPFTSTIASDITLVMPVVVFLPALATDTPTVQVEPGGREVSTSGVDIGRVALEC